MSTQWETVRIFISSTFEDMHAERDYLIKKVFPELREWCEQRKLNLVDIDLRWGVKEDDTQNKNVVEVCLKRIDEARPFFLCFLGQRRGWIPQAKDVSSATLAVEAFPDLTASIGNASVTEMEIMHALIHPFHRSRPHKEQEPEFYEPVKHAFFYLREPSYLEEMPTDFPDLRKIFTNEALSSPEEQSLANQQLEKWRLKEIPALCQQKGLPLRHYQAHWNQSASSPELLIPLASSSLLPANQKSWQKRWAEAGVRAENTSIDDPLQVEKARVYNQKRSRGRLTDFEIEGNTLKEIVLQDLKLAIAERFPQHTIIEETSDLQKELDQQEQFLQVCREGFISRGDDFKELDQYIQGDSQQAFLLTAPGGVGKSTLLANWVDELRSASAGNPQTSFHYRFIGQSDWASNVDSLLYFLLKEIKEITGKLEEPLPETPAELRQELFKLLAGIGKNGKTILILDALNQLENGLSDLSWLPWQIPENVKLIVSFKSGEADAEELMKRLEGQVRHAEVRPFTSLEDRRKLVKVYLSQYLKDLDEHHIEALIQSEGASNPLFLKVALSELRVFGAFGNLSEKIKRDFGETPLSAFTGVLKRLEEDPVYSAIDPHLAVPLLFGLLTQARAGFSAEELTRLILRELGPEENEEKISEVSDAIFLFLRQVRPFLAHRDGRFDFFYESFKLAALQRYESLYGPQGWQSKLADYFGKLPTWQDKQKQVPTARKIAEFPYHLAMSGQRDAYINCLTDFDFLQAKVIGMGAPAVLEDFKLKALPVLGLEAQIVQDLTLLERSINISLQNLQFDPRLLAGQLFARLGDLKIPTIEKILVHASQWTDRPWIRPLTSRFNKPESALQTTYQASNHYIAEALPTPDGRTLIVLSYETEKPELTLKRLEAFTGKVIHQIGLEKNITNAQMALNPDGRKIVILTAKFLFIYDSESLSLEQAYPVNVESVGANRDFLRLSPDGLFAFVIEQNMLSQIRLQNGERVRQFRVEQSMLDFIFSPNGRMAAFCTGSMRFLDDVSTIENYYQNNNTDELFILDLQNAVPPKLISAHALSDNFIFSADGEHLICVNESGRLETWQISNGKSLGVLQALTDQQFEGVLQGFQASRPHYRGEGKIVTGMRGEKALCSFGSAYMATFNISNPHAVSIEHHLYSPGPMSRMEPAYGAYAVSLTLAEELIIWDMENGKLAGRLKDNSPIRDFSVAHFGDWAVIFSKNDQSMLRVWDISNLAESTQAQPGADIAENASILGMKSHPMNESICVSKIMSNQFYDIESKGVLAEIRTAPPILMDMHYHPDGERMILVYIDGSIKIISLETYQPLKTLQLSHLAAGITTSTLSSDGIWLLFGEDNNGLYMLNLESADEFAFEETSPLDSNQIPPASDAIAIKELTPTGGAPTWGRSEIVILPESQQVLSFCYVPYVYKPYQTHPGTLEKTNGWMELHDLKTGKFIKKSNDADAHPVILKTQAARNGRSAYELIARRDVDAYPTAFSFSLEEIDADLGIKQVLPAWKSRIRDFCVSPDEAFVALVTDNGTLEYVSMNSGETMARFKGDAIFNYCLAIEDGRTLCASDEHGEVNFFRVENVARDEEINQISVFNSMPEIASEWQCTVLGKKPYSVEASHEKIILNAEYNQEQSKTPAEKVMPAGSFLGGFFKKTNNLFVRTDSKQKKIKDKQPDNLANKGNTGGELSVELAPDVNMEFVRVPAGDSLMGRDKKNDQQASDEETPQHTVRLSEYLIGKYPVTNKQYQVFVKAVGYKQPTHWKDGVIPDGKQDHPVVHVSWQDAVAFCKWVSRVSKQQVRLPSEAEWEKAARGTDGRTYPWGEEINGTYANYGGADTTPVGSYEKGKSPYGAYDMSGNVLEWVEDWYAAYPGNNTSSPDFGTTYRVQRGGDWSLKYVINLRVSYRARYFPDQGDDVGGFRCAI